MTPFPSALTRINLHILKPSHQKQIKSHIPEFKNYLLSLYSYILIHFLRQISQANKIYAENLHAFP